MEKLKVNKIYIFDDASEGKKTDITTKKLDSLKEKGFWKEYLMRSENEGIEAYIRGKKYINGVWGDIGNDNEIGFNTFTNNKLNDVLTDALSSSDTAILIDYYLVDNPTGETEETALVYLRKTLEKRIKQMSEHKVRILFFSQWPNPKMIRTIREINNPNVYYTKLDFRSDIEEVTFVLEEFFRIVRINESEE